MKINKTILLNQLVADVNNNIKQAQKLQAEPACVLSRLPNRNEWSILQVIEHLNTYNNYYLNKINNALANGLKSNEVIYKSGLLGDYFVKLMQPVDGAIAKKYKAAKLHLPAPVVDVKVIENYVAGQQALLSFIEKSVTADLTRNKIAISISPLVKLRLGDVYRFLIAHQQRHFVQIASIQKLITK